MLDDSQVREQLVAAGRLAREGRVEAARATLERLNLERPDSPVVAIALARMALASGDVARAEAALSVAAQANRENESVAVELAVTRAGAGDLPRALEALNTLVARAPDSPLAWLLLGQMLDDLNRRSESAQARFEALARAQRLQVWRDPASTPAHLVDTIASAYRFVREHRREIFDQAVAPLRAEHGTAAMARVDRALAGYLGERAALPPDPMQRPRFFHFPGLPVEPYMDPFLQPWAGRLKATFPAMRAEAIAALRQDGGLEDFVQVPAGDRIENYLAGQAPAWEAFFFYRHGQRYDANHERCPRTSALLESIDLCRIPGQTPEICFSVLAPGTHILPHHGVTNTRAVMHLPLIVPEGCALQLVDRGQHHWQEGEPVMFDDTYLHEAWNRSGSARVILLMDCWNPHLSAAEREAVSRICQTIGMLDLALGSKVWAAAG